MLFGKKWEKAQALIVEARTQRGGGRDTFVHEFVADVTTASGETFRTTLEDPLFSPDFLEPEVRDVVGVEFDPKSRTVRFDTSDPKLSIRAHRHAERERFDQALRQPSGTEGPTPIQQLTMRHARIDELAALREQGAISDGDYRSQVRAILREGIARP
jgi:hypothetical protein